MVRFVRSVKLVRVDWGLVAVWSTGALLHIGAVIRSWWINRDIRRRLIESDWTKIQRSETKRGYRLWLERQCCPKKSILETNTHYFPLERPLPNDYNWDEWVERELTSVFVMIDHKMPNRGQKVRILRRFSLYDTSVYTDVAQMIYSTGEGWRSMYEIQLDDRTVASAFKKEPSGQICVVLIDVKQRTYEFLNVPPIYPGFGDSIKVLYIRRGDGEHSNRLRIVCVSSRWNQNEIISIDYKVHPSKKDPSRLFAGEGSRKSIVIPGRRAWFVSNIPGVYMLRANKRPTSKFVYVIKIDQRGDFQIHLHDEWKRAIMATDLEQRSRKAIDDFKSMLPTEWRGKCKFYRYSKHIIGRIGDSFAKRQIYPPSMMHVAAEAICQSNPPNADLSMIKSEIGIDIFDGIYEDQKKPVPTINLAERGGIDARRMIRR